MATTSTPQGSLRQRSVGRKKDGAVSDVEPDDIVKTSVKKPRAASSERDYKVTLVFITALAFLTRFWGISHPNEVVFDEVHFGKVLPSSPTLSLSFLPTASPCRDSSFPSPVRLLTRVP